MTHLQSETIAAIEGMHRTALAEMLRDICANMIERKDHEGIAKFVEHQLDGDTADVVASYAAKGSRT